MKSSFLFLKPASLTRNPGSVHLLEIVCPRMLFRTLFLSMILSKCELITKLCVRAKDRQAIVLGAREHE